MKLHQILFSLILSGGLTNELIALDKMMLQLMPIAFNVWKSGSYSCQNNSYKLSRNCKSYESSRIFQLPKEIIQKISIDLVTDSTEGINLESLAILGYTNTFFHNLIYDDPNFWQQLVPAARKLKEPIGANQDENALIYNRICAALLMNYRKIKDVLLRIYNENDPDNNFDVILHKDGLSEWVPDWTPDTSYQSLALREDFLRNQYDWSGCFHFHKKSKDSTQFLSNRKKFPYLMKEYTEYFVGGTGNLPSGLIARIVNKKENLKFVPLLLKEGFNSEGIIQRIVLYQEDTDDIINLLNKLIEKLPFTQSQAIGVLHNSIKTNKLKFLSWLFDQKDTQGNCFITADIINNNSHGNRPCLHEIILTVEISKFAQEIKRKKYAIVQLLKKQGADPYTKYLYRSSFFGERNMNVFEFIEFLYGHRPQERELAHNLLQ